VFRFAFSIAATAALCSVAAAVPPPSSPAANPWANRSGKAEALADLAKGLPVKLLYQVIWGEREVIRVTGLSNCDPDRFDVPKNARSRFEAVGADYSENSDYTAEDYKRFHAGSQFARAYNSTMFERNRAGVLAICPAAKLK
jgi:hypothetical protein